MTLTINFLIYLYQLRTNLEPNKLINLFILTQLQYLKFRIFCLIKVYQNHSSAESMNFENEEELQVQKILDKKVFNGKTLYLVKWKNYPIQEATWECNKILTSVKDKIREFKHSKRGTLTDPNLKIEDDHFPDQQVRDTFKRKRGRPSKLTYNNFRLDPQKMNDQEPKKTTAQAQPNGIPKRGRGRPRGSKNKKSIQVHQSESSFESNQSGQNSQQSELAKSLEKSLSNEETKSSKKYDKFMKKIRKINGSVKSSEIQLQILETSEDHQKVNANDAGQLKRHLEPEKQRIKQLQKTNQENQNNQFLVTNTLNQDPNIGLQVNCIPTNFNDEPKQYLSNHQIAPQMISQTIETLLKAVEKLLLVQQTFNKAAQSATTHKFDNPGENLRLISGVQIAKVNVNKKDEQASSMKQKLFLQQKKVQEFKKFIKAPQTQQKESQQKNNQSFKPYKKSTIILNEELKLPKLVPINEADSRKVDSATKTTKLLYEE